MNLRTSTLAAVLASAFFLFACGGGSGTAPSGGGTVSGAVVKGPVGGASVTAFAIAGGSKGAQVGSGRTDASGHFSISVGDYAGPLLIQASGGTYADEATGTVMTMQAADEMASAVSSVAAGAATAAVQITPLTSMAQAMASHMAGGMTAANIDAANSAVGSYFSVSDILRVMPMDPTVAGTTADPDARNYGMVLAAMSQYAKTVGMTTSSSGIVTAMMDDASDGLLDGMIGSTAISMAGMGGMMGGTMATDAGTAGLSAAMGTFIASGMNRSGVTAGDMQALMTRLATSGGQLTGTGGGTTQGMMGGTAFMGAMSSGTVAAYAVSGGAMAARLGTSSLDGAGHFSIPLGGYAGTVMVQVTGGTYLDPATGTTMTMGTGDVLTSCVPSFEPGSTTTIQVTPLTSMAQAMAQGMAGGMTAANVGAASAAVGSYFMAGDILGTPPMDPASAASASPDAQDYGMAIAAMSQYALTIGMTGPSSAMVTAMTQDAADGVMNGMMGSTAISMGGMGGGMMGGSTMPASAGTSGLASAMSAFAGSAMNRSGVTASDLQTLVDKLAASSGTIQ